MYTEIHTALKALSSTCDHACSKDGHGFNKLDSQFGKDLAAKPSLTYKQAAAGYKLLQKYKKQLLTVHDIDYSSIPIPKAPPEGTQKKKTFKTATLKDNTIILKFFQEKKDFYATVDQIKSIPGRRFNSAGKFWTVPLHMDSIESILAFDFTIDKDLEKWSIQEAAKIESVLQQIEELEYDSDILYDFQIEQAKKLIHSIIKHDSALDASDTGTGKTFVALAVCKHFDLFPIVLTPKSVAPTWTKVAKKVFQMNCFSSNYEQYRNGNNKYISFEIEKYTKTVNGELKEFEQKKFTWHTKENHCIIFDEAHRCKNQKTQNAFMMQAVVNSKSKAMALSATIGDNPLHMYSVGRMLKLFKTIPDFWRWAYAHGVKKGFYGMEFSGSEKDLKDLKAIHEDLFPNHGGRIAIKDLGDKFPKNFIMADPYNMSSNSKKIQKIYDEMKEEISSLKKTVEKDKGTSILTEILRARQQIELLKIPTIVEMAEDLIEEGNSVAIFVNFKESIKALSEKLKTSCIIDGSVTGENREANMKAFQSDQERIILCNIKAGGVGISLHDLNGNHSRVSLISPTNSAQDLLQTLGRIHRAGAQSPAIQKLIFAAGTIEEEVAEKVGEKIANIQMINDGDLADEKLLNLFNKEKE